MGRRLWMAGSHAQAFSTTRGVALDRELRRARSRAISVALWSADCRVSSRRRIQAANARDGARASLVPWVPALRHTALKLMRFGSKCSAMHVTLRGRDLENKPLSRTWSL